MIVKTHLSQATIGYDEILRTKNPQPNRPYPILNNISNNRHPLGNPTHKNTDSPETNRTDSHWSAHLFLAIIVGGCALFSSPILLYPQHNSIQHPKYWYEPIISGSLSVILTTSLDSLVSLKYYFREESMVSFGVFIMLYVATVAAFGLTYCMVYLLWTVGLEYNHPMPFMLLGGYVQYSVHYMTLNILFHKKVPSSNTATKRLRAFNISRVWTAFVDLQFRGLSFIFSMAPSEYQWLLAFGIPLLREFNFRMIYRIFIENPKVKNGKMAVIIGVNAFTSLYVAIKLGHTATQTTSVLILSIDFILNLYSSLMIINKHRSTAINSLSITIHLKEMDYLVSKLILIELLEVLVPVSYIITVLIAYYGPNAEILGNIRNDYWQYESIEDIWEIVKVVLMMFIFDGCSAIIAGFMLWRVCSIDVLRKTSKLIGDLWPIIAVNIANYMNYVSFMLMLQCLIP